MRSAPLLAAAALASAAAFALQTPSALHAASAPPTPSPDATFTWLEAELTANGGTLPSPYDPTATDWGLTSDAIMALALGGRGAASAATTATTALATNIDDYITGNAFGDPGVYSGPVGKSLLVAELQGADVNAFGVADLEALSRAAMETTGVQTGRFSDQGSLFGNFSNGLGQALNVMGLSYSDGGVPADALAFLLDQQCPNGSFRLYYDDSDDATPLVRGCTEDAEGDTDATALALSALLAVTPSTDVRAAIDDASAWLLAVQDPTTHGFGGTGLTAAVNTNTTGLAAQALRAAGYSGEADLAAAYVASLELNPTNTAGSPAAGDVGAIAADQTTFDAALATGIPALGRDQWRRSTAQAVLAYGLPTFGNAPDMVALEPARLLDTRPGASTIDGLHVGTGPVVAGKTIELPVAGRGGVPLGAAAVVLNVTATDATGTGYVTVYPCAERPTASSVNFVAGTASPNAVIAKLSPTGTVCLYVAEAATQLIADVNGYAPTGSAYGALQPARLLDTRPGASTIDGLHVGTGTVVAGKTLELPVAGRGGVPAGAAAVVLNVTATDATGTGFVTVWDCSTPRPTASSINFVVGSAAPNAVIAKLSASGTICAYVAEAATQLIADANGYFPAGSDYEALVPARLLDTRPGAPTVDGLHAGTGLVAAGTTVELPVTGRGGVPVGTTAVALNVTATDASGIGYVTVYPCGDVRPEASTLNTTADGATPNAVVAKVSAEGTVCLYVAEAATQLIADVGGYFR